ncbi:MAG: hypothetical protein IKK54_02025 [Anaerotignum sp.]|nr:hypothetical protein [Anaerotignum sp.]
MNKQICACLEYQAGDSLFSSTEVNSVCGFDSGNLQFPEPFRVLYGKLITRTPFQGFGYAC